MPGYKIHDATGNTDKMLSLIYRKGLNSPDYFKKINSEEEFTKYFSGCDPKDIPSYEEFLIIKQDTHFGYSSDPDIKKFLSLEFVDTNKLFWEGYLIHLIGDREIYKPENGCINWDEYVKEGSQKQKLHRDWNIINKLINDMFRIPILPEILELGVVKYIEGDLSYVNLENLLKVIEKVRTIALDSNSLEAYLKEL